MHALVEQARAQQIGYFAFGDLHLADIRAYRESQLAGSGIDPLFPIWGLPTDTPALAQTMIASGLRAILSCVDPRQLASTFAGRTFDTALLDELPSDVDPCGEKGEFHTFCHAGPMFDHPIAVSVGETVERDGFCFTDLLPARAE